MLIICTPDGYEKECGYSKAFFPFKSHAVMMQYSWASKNNELKTTEEFPEQFNKQKGK